jgi:hypothetical protein
MKPPIALLIILSAISTAALAEINKCQLASGKTVYQPTPCSPLAVTQKKVDVKPLSPQQQQEAQNKLKAWQAYQAAEDDAKNKAAKVLQEQQTRQAEALENRNNTYNNGVPYYGPIYYGQQPYGIPHDYHQYDDQYYPHNDNSAPPPDNQKRPIGSLITKGLMDCCS